jgi:hypothetical protein
MEFEDPIGHNIGNTILPLIIYRHFKDPAELRITQNPEDQ